MGLFGKKNQEMEEIPSLPELPAPKDFSLPDLPKNPPEIQNKEISSLPPLPSLPEFKKTEPDLSPKVIKQEIANPEQPMQKSQFNPTLPTIQKPPTQIKTRSAKETEPIYVRLDKFQTSVEAVEDIKSKIEQIEELLTKVKDVKQKEEQELQSWEREIQLIKARIDSVDKSIFNKLD